MNYKSIAKELSFSLKDTKSLITIISHNGAFISEHEFDTNVNNLENNIIKFWNDYCFRANDFEEILEYYKDEKMALDDLYVSKNIFILPSGMLVITC